MVRATDLDVFVFILGSVLSAAHACVLQMRGGLCLELETASCCALGSRLHVHTVYFALHDYLTLSHPLDKFVLCILLRCLGMTHSHGLMGYCNVANVWSGLHAAWPRLERRGLYFLQIIGELVGKTCPSPARAKLNASKMQGRM